MTQKNTKESFQQEVKFIKQLQLLVPNKQMGNRKKVIQIILLALSGYFQEDSQFQERSEIQKQRLNSREEIPM